jgi:ABC-type phosphate/phosphonate transport system substrate-binding protein
MSALPKQPISRRAALRGVAAAAATCAVPFAWAQRAAEGQCRLLINEGTTADLSISMLATRYRDWADYLATQIRYRQVMVEPVIDIRRFVQQAVSDQKPLMVFGKSVNQLSLLVRDHGYQPVARRMEPYTASFIVPRNSSIEGIAQLGGRKLVLPDESSAATALGKAELRRLNVRAPALSYMRFQDSVTAQLHGGMADAGVVDSGAAKKWVQDGGRIIGETRPVVNWSVLAAPGAPADTVARLTESLLAMNSQFTGILADIGVKQWVRASRPDYLALLEYTGE